jgi:heat shock protein HslJ
MKFNSKLFLATLAAPLLLTACTSTSDTVEKITPSDLQHHNWQLTAVNGEAILDQKNIPNLEVGEAMTANGNAGCNQFFGQAELKDNQFRVEKMGMTMKLCQDSEMEIEKAFTNVLSDWSDMTLTKDSLTLSNDTYTLNFTLRDWVN